MNVSQRILDWLSRYEWSKKPHGNCGLIFIEPNGVSVRLDSPYWDAWNAFLTLSIMDLLDQTVINTDEVVAWVKSCQLENGLFFNELGRTVRDATSVACAILRMFDQHLDSHGWRRNQLIEMLRNQQNPAKRQHFEFLPRDNRRQYSELEVAAKCIGSLAALDESLPDPTKAIDYVYRKQQEDGTFKSDYATGVGGGNTEELMYWALQCLTLLDDGRQNYDAQRTAILSWRQVDGGFEATPTFIKRSELGSTLLAVRCLYLLGDVSGFDQSACIARIMQHFDAEKGAFMNKTDSVGPKTLPWTYAAMTVLAILGEINGKNLHDRVLYTVF